MNTAFDRNTFTDISFDAFDHSAPHQFFELDPKIDTHSLLVSLLVVTVPESCRIDLHMYIITSTSCMLYV
jgi:hypothetical protein